MNSGNGIKVRIFDLSKGLVEYEHTYTDVKNPELEKQIEQVLKRHKIYYTKSEVWIESEKLYEELYETEV